MMSDSKAYEILGQIYDAGGYVSDWLLCEIGFLMHERISFPKYDCEQLKRENLEYHFGKDYADGFIDALKMSTPKGGYK